MNKFTEDSAKKMKKFSGTTGNTADCFQADLSYCCIFAYLTRKQL